MNKTDAQSIDTVETQRLQTQYQLDERKNQVERNQLGQFATPPGLATDILAYAKALISPASPIRFLDPAFGTGSFYTALLRSFPPAQIAQAWGYEIDPYYGEEAKKLWSNTPLKLSIADFTRAKPPSSNDDRANLLICNPPYVRHHHLAADEKLRLQMITRQLTGLKLSGLAGLYCYFLLLAHSWLADGGLAGWLIPSEFMDVNYGKQVKQYLQQHVTLLHIHRFSPDDIKFEDALVSSTVVWYKKEKPPANHRVEFSYGGELTKPKMSQLVSMDTLEWLVKWTSLPKTSSNSMPHNLSPINAHLTPKLSDLFNIKRGLVTGANKFFILEPEQISENKLPAEFLSPILPSPRYLLNDEFAADENGNPYLDKRLFLLTCNLSEDQVQRLYPLLWKYLQSGVRQGLPNRYLCRHRTPWYAQENRPAAPLLCTYMGRQAARGNRPFRFILNHSTATAPNVYLMLYPKPTLAAAIKGTPTLLRAIWQALNQIPPETLMGEGRVYGGGLHKIEPNELANTPADSILAILPELSESRVKQLSLF